MTEDLGTTPRKPLSRTDRLKMFEAHGGKCCICGQKIEYSKGFVDEHIRPLALGGSNDLSNRGPAHKLCAEAKTEQDMARIVKAKAQKMAALGIKADVGKPLIGSSFPIGKRRTANPTPLPPRRSIYADAK